MSLAHRAMIERRVFDVAGAKDPLEYEACVGVGKIALFILVAVAAARSQDCRLREVGQHLWTLAAERAEHPVEIQHRLDLKRVADAGLTDDIAELSGTRELRHAANEVFARVRQTRDGGHIEAPEVGESAPEHHGGCLTCA